jgi:hypothetical protein
LASINTAMRTKRKATCVRGKVQQRDRPPLEGRSGSAQILLQGVVKSHLAAPGSVGKEKRRKYFCQRRDLKNEEIMKISGEARSKTLLLRAPEET